MTPLFQANPVEVLPAGQADWPARPTVRALIDRAAALSGFPPATILGSCRRSDIVLIRFAVIWVARRMGFSSALIGRVINRDHSTVLNGAQRAREMMTRSQPYEAFCLRLGAPQ